MISSSINNFTRTVVGGRKSRLFHQRFVINTNTNTKRCISSKDLIIERKTDDTDYKNRPNKEDLLFGTTMSDHMLTIEWDIDNQWHKPKIVPYQDLKISPAASSLHYGLQCFEGMKAYKSLTSAGGEDDADVLLFRPDLNMKRLESSMSRLSMPGSDFNHDELIECIKELVRIDSKWIPYGEGYSLYIRPTVIATHKFLGLSAPTSILLYVITSPVGPYYKTGFNPVQLTADTQYVRAWPGGTGNVKVGGNYAPTMKAQQDASDAGYSQVLWLYEDTESGKELVTEVGSMNVFFCIINKETNRKELITAPLMGEYGDLILPGVTRNSVLSLARSWDDMDIDVVERFLSMSEIIDAANDGRLVEAFGAGTAAVVSPISGFQHQGQDIPIEATGSITQRVWDEITGIQYGKMSSPNNENWSIKL